MNDLKKRTRADLIEYLKTIGFSIGEAETRIESLESDEELEYFAKYIAEHEVISKDELRFVHTDIVRGHNSKLIGTNKAQPNLEDYEGQKNRLLVRSVKIDWNNDSIDPYISCIKSVSRLKSLEFSKPITFFVGENGSGKSTLLEGMAIASGYNPEGGTKNYDFSTRDTHSGLHNAITIVKGIRKPSWGIFLRAETFYNMASETDDLGVNYSRYGGLSFHEQSHGESFFSMLQGDIKENGLYFLDEPEAALSPRRQLNLLGIIHKYADRGAQFFIATHSPILLACPGATIYEFSNNGVNEIGYEDTDIYKIVYGFVNNRDEMIKSVIIDDRRY